MNRITMGAVAGLLLALIVQLLYLNGVSTVILPLVLNGAAGASIDAMSCCPPAMNK